MSDNKGFRVIIVGAGPVGLYMAHALAAANISFMVLEQQPTVFNYSGALLFTWPQTVRLLDQIGLYEAVKQASVGIQLKKRVAGEDGTVLTTSRFWGLMHENDLVRILYESLPDRETRIRTSAEVVNMNTDPDGVRVYLKDGTCHQGSIVIGADGVHSKTRSLMQENNNNNNNPMQATFCSLLGRAPNTLGLEEGTFFESRGGAAAVQCTAAEDGTIYFCTLKRLSKPMQGRVRYTAEQMEKHAATLADVWVAPGLQFGRLWEMADKRRTRMLNQDEGWAERWHHGGRIVLLGDAVHKTTSINGLGLTNGLHSAAALGNELQRVLVNNNKNELNKLPSSAELGLAFERYYNMRCDESRVICTRGWNMIREVTQRGSWLNRFWDSWVLPWIDSESVVRGLFVSLMLVRHGQALSYVAFDGLHGMVPWARHAEAKVKSQ